jgi:hypothetical protein
MAKTLRSHSRKHFAERGNLCRARQRVIEIDDE